MIKLTHSISEDGTTLTLLADAEAKAELAEMKADDPGNWGTHRAESEALEYLLGNSELRLLDPADTGDLTDAHLLGILGETSDVRQGPYGCAHVGCWGGKQWYDPVEQRWGYAHYALRSFLTDLLEDGQAVFSNQW